MNMALRSLLCTWLSVVAAWPHADARAGANPPPALETSPDPAPANRPFPATFRLYTYTATVGFWQEPQIDISGSTITIGFDRGCGILCAPQMTYKSFPFEMPALQAGTYTVIFGSLDNVIAEFDLAVGLGGQTPLSAPMLGWPALFLLITLFAIIATIRQRARHSTSSGHSPS